MLPGFFHDTLGEKDRAERARPRRARFLLDRFAAPPAPPDLRDAHRHGFTQGRGRRAGARRCRRSRRAASTGRDAREPALRRRRCPRASRLGHATGFDSGSTLDYVYRNEARGRTPLGRLDRPHLSRLDRLARHPPAQASIVEELLREAMARAARRAACRCASSTSRPVTAATCSTRSTARRRAPRFDPAARLLRRSTCEQGSALIAAAQPRATSRASSRPTRSTARASRRSTPRPTIGIVSGLYELFPDNDAGADVARRARRRDRARRLSRLHRPALASAARADRARAHQPSRRQAWVMRRRTQAEMDQLVAAAGFRKVEQRIDEWGIFTVSLARSGRDAVMTRRDRPIAAAMPEPRRGAARSRGSRSSGRSSSPPTASRTGSPRSARKCASVVFDWEHADPVRAVDDRAVLDRSTRSTACRSSSAPTGASSTRTRSAC